VLKKKVGKVATIRALPSERVAQCGDCSTGALVVDRVALEGTHIEVVKGTDLVGTCVPVALPLLAPPADHLEAARRTPSKAREVMSKLDHRTNGLIAGSETGARQYEAHAVAGDVQPRDQAPQKQRDLGSARAPVHVRFAEDQQELVGRVRTEPVARLLKDLTLDGSHEHVFQHRIVRDEHIGAPDLHLMPRHQFTVARLREQTSVPIAPPLRTSPGCHRLLKPLT
jgi:hypothetical protein